MAKSKPGKLSEIAESIMGFVFFFLFLTFVIFGKWLTVAFFAIVLGYYLYDAIKNYPYNS